MTAITKSTTTTTTTLACSKPELLVFGYLRQFEGNSSTLLHLPHVIYTVVFKFFPKMQPYPGVFEDKNHGSSIQVLDEHTIVMISYVSTIRMSVPISVDDVNNYYWYFKIESQSPENGYHFLGVIADTSPPGNFKENPYSGVKDAWGLSGNRRDVMTGLGHNTHVKDFGCVIAADDKKAHLGPVIRCEYRGAEKAVEFRFAHPHPVQPQPRHSAPAAHAAHAAHAARAANALHEKQIPASNQIDTDIDVDAHRFIYKMSLPTVDQRPDIRYWYPCIAIADKGNKGYFWQEYPRNQKKFDN